MNNMKKVVANAAVKSQALKDIKNDSEYSSSPDFKTKLENNFRSSLPILSLEPINLQLLRQKHAKH